MRQGRVCPWSASALVTAASQCDDGSRFPPSTLDRYARLGSTELWELRNDSSITHFIHLHEELWHTISRDGHAPPPWERLGLEDTWRLDPGESVLVAARFTDYTGRFMVHCHMLDHEDHGLMSQFAVVKGKAGQRDVQPTASHGAASAQDAGHQHMMVGVTAAVMAPADNLVTRPIRHDRVAERAGSALVLETLVVGALLLARRRPHLGRRTG